MKIQMVDLKGQYMKIKPEVDAAIQDVIDNTAFINGPIVKEFAQNLSNYMGVCHVITCANGTDALQIALMALGLKPGDEVIVPAFTYVASAEVIGLLGLTPVMVDVDYNTFNVTVENIKKGLSEKTKAIIPVHLFGQSCDMEPILNFAKEHNLYVIEDNAQAIGAEYTFSDGHKEKTGTMGTIGCTSFFPSKNLGCYGDGGAIFCKGCNSRLDSIQAAILNVKLKHLDEYSQARYAAASYYTEKLKAFDPDEKYFITPKELEKSTHVYHQYTLKIKNGKRDALKQFLADAGIPSMIYYPLPLQEQEAFKFITRAAEELSLSKDIAYSVLSLPVHTEMTTNMQDIIMNSIFDYFGK